MNSPECKTIVSACLVGIPCNYKGEARRHPLVVELVTAGNAIPVCPEGLGGLVTPRPAAERKGTRVITINGADVTAQFEAGAREVLQIAQRNDCTQAILKARSPSCGVGRIYSGDFSGKLVEGDGVTAALLIANNIKVITEEDI